MLPRWLKEVSIPGAILVALGYCWTGELPVGRSLMAEIHGAIQQWLLVNTKYPVAFVFFAAFGVAYVIFRLGIWWFHTRKRRHLAEIARLRDEVAALRIQMEADTRSKKNWQPKFRKLKDDIIEKIKENFSEAESLTFGTAGNLLRRFHPKLPKHQLYIDICIRDLDYLDQFIRDYSRGAK